MGKFFRDDVVGRLDQNITLFIMKFSNNKTLENPTIFPAAIQKKPGCGVLFFQ